MTNPKHNQNHTNNNGFNHQDDDQSIVVVIVPLPAQGHLNQLLHLSRLISSYNIPVHFVSTPIHSRQAKQRVHGWTWDWEFSNYSKNLHFHDFSIPHFLSPPPNPNLTNKFPSHLQPSFTASALHLREPVSKLLRSLAYGSKRVVVIHDSLMASAVQEVGLIQNAESYTFHSVSAFATLLYILESSAKSLGEFEDFIPVKDIPSLESCFTSEFLDFIASMYEFRKFSSGDLFNTCKIIEKPYIDLLKSTDHEKKYWAIGPFNPVKIVLEKKNSTKRHFCLEWLDKQEPNTVIYVSFGTTTAMTDEQIKELAIGLEKCKQKFIWVLRDADKGDIFYENHLRKIKIPEGFEERVKERGIVIRDWAPQLEILSHESTGGFMSHCGWNSCMESITMGVPMAAWPMHSDQPRNTVLVTRLLNVGLVLKDWGRRDEVVTWRVVESCVSRLMRSEEGDAMRRRAAELGWAVRRSVEDGGVSRAEMDSFVAHLTR